MWRARGEALLQRARARGRGAAGGGGRRRVYVVCRNGIDSQEAARALWEAEGADGEGRWIGDVVGGLRAWREEVDLGFPEY